MKKLFILIHFSLLFGWTYAQDFTIKGTAPKGAKTAILRLAGKVDTAHIQQGLFNFKGTTQQPDLAFLGFDDENETQTGVILTATPITLNFITNKVKGSSLTQKLWNYLDTLNQKEKQLEAIVGQYRQAETSTEANKEERLKNLEKNYQERLVEMQLFLKQVIKANSDNILPAFFIRNLASSLPEEELFALADPQLPYMQIPATKRLVKYVQSKKNTAIGKAYTDLEMNDPEGKTIKLSQFVGKGKYVLVDFWASWCGPCRKEMPHIVKLYETYKDKGLEIVGVSFDQKAEPWKKALSQMQMTWPQMSDLKGWESIAASIYGINSIPSTLLISPEGLIIAKNLRGEDLENKIAEVLNK